jgi:hypothetical protein
MDRGNTYSKDNSTRFGSFQTAYEHLGRVCSGLEKVRVHLDGAPGMPGKPLFIPIFSRQSGGTIVAESRLMVKQDKRFGLDQLVLRIVVAARLFNDGDGFLVDVLVDGTWDDAYWGAGDSQRILALHEELTAIAAGPPSIMEGAMPTSLLILAQELSARRDAVVSLVHVKDALYCLTASTTWRRARHKDPEIILYYDAAEGGKVGVQFLKRGHVNALSKAARAIENVDLDLAEKIARLKQDRLIEQARQRYAARDTGVAMAFQSSYIMSEVDPMFIYFAVQGLDSFGTSLRAVGGSLRFDGTSISGAGRATGNVFTDAGSIGEAFKGGSDDDGAIFIILLIVAIVAFLVTIGLVVWGIQKAMTRAEHGDTSMTYYISAKAKIHKYRAPRIYVDDLKSR